MSTAGRARFVHALTFSRVPLIFAWLVCAVVGEYRSSWAWAAAACLAMLLSGLTDAWDGSLARKWNVVSTLGKMSDPLMDKVFYLVAFPTLVWLVAHQGESQWHAMALLGFTILYMLRDTWVTFLRSVGALYGAEVGAMTLGKVRTALSFPGAGWVYVYCAFHRFSPSEWWCGWLASCYLVEAFLAVLTIVSLFTYTRAYEKFLKKALA